MADVDSSLLYFCSLVARKHKVALTGECADEIFGGYPWFHKKECFLADTFPWTMDLEARKVLLSDDFLDFLKMEDYVKHAYEASVAEVPKLAGEGAEEARRREISYLNLRWFMQTLLNRMDRTSMYSGLEARVPFAYPKTYDRKYEALLAGRVRDILNDSSSPVLGFVDKKKAERFLESPSDYGKPWYGQLMAAPQLMAYLIQVDFWIREYHVTVIR